MQESNRKQNRKNIKEKDTEKSNIALTNIHQTTIRFKNKGKVKPIFRLTKQRIHYQ